MSAQSHHLILRPDPHAQAPVHALETRDGDWALASGHVIALPWILMVIQQRRSDRLVDLELVLVGTSRDGVWRAVRVDLPFPHDIRILRAPAQDLALRELPEHATIRTADGHAQHVDIWVLTDGTPIYGRLALAAADAVVDLVAPFGFNMEHP